MDGFDLTLAIMVCAASTVVHLRYFRVAMYGCEPRDESEPLAVVGGIGGGILHLAAIIYLASNHLDWVTAAMSVAGLAFVAVGCLAGCAVGIRMGRAK